MQHSEITLKALERACAELARAQERRDDAIARAFEEGVPTREIARRVGLTSPAVLYRLSRMGLR